MAFALTEPVAWSDPSSMVTKFEDRGNHFLLNGKKHWSGNGKCANVMTTYAKATHTTITIVFQSPPQLMTAIGILQEVDIF